MILKGNKVQSPSNSPDVLEANERGLASENIPQTQELTATPLAYSKNLTFEDYTVGWISAFPIDSAAAKEMLDEVHPAPPKAIAEDPNIYVFGKIHGHNVALACLPAGKNDTSSAAMVASHMMRTFPNLRFGLMVGIASGLPSENNDADDIRLGDVVVSKPQGIYGKADLSLPSRAWLMTKGGVIQVDLGKDTPRGFERTGMLNRPPPVLLTAVSAMESELVFNKSGDLPQPLEDYRRRGANQAEALKCDASHDKLYQPGYDHPQGKKTCESCDQAKVVPREERSQNGPVVHYGLIASGNHAPYKDRLRKELGVFCFEREAAGLMNHFPCIVIRGISDYFDSHVDERWQLYAATVAAVYTKGFLSKIPPTGVNVPGLERGDLERA
ncbi:nacht and ankyrin domain protein [Diplodia corticola]|uniref:Nacht and ankyrin domain protein n=1 Tax=Diplodia corticola TaxID=236234 RepID=A0A1J9QKN7_9PEZI|nr:nacht and ankyrin domain protein [Diplodia corticola]OJD29040.1 nacht and ankyrin domain protein [Diplodia corticola]